MKQTIIFRMLPFTFALMPFMVIFNGEKTVPVFFFAIVILLCFEKEIKNNYLFNKAILLPFLIAIVTFLIFTILAPNFSLALKVLERQISLIAIPLLLIFGNWNNERIKIFFKYFVWILFIIGIFSIFSFLWFILSNSDWISYVESQNGSKLLYLQYKYPHILGTHPTYWSYLLVSGLIMILFNQTLNILKNKYIIVGLLLFFNVNLIFLASRTPLMISFLIMLLVAYNFFTKQKVTFKFKFGVLIILIILLTIVFKSPLLLGKFRNIPNDERLSYWPLALKTISQNYYALGEGLGQGNEIIKKHIIEYGDTREVYKGYDLHNQYLRHFLDMGILGVISLLILLIYPITLTNNKLKIHRRLYFSFLLLFSIALITESYLYRLKGIVFFTVLTSFLCLRANLIIESKKEVKSIRKH